VRAAVITALCCTTYDIVPEPEPEPEPKQILSLQSDAVTKAADEWRRTVDVKRTADARLASTLKRVQEAEHTMEEDEQALKNLQDELDRVVSKIRMDMKGP
jgi:hypothetical protein